MQTGQNDHCYYNYHGYITRRGDQAVGLMLHLFPLS